VNNENVRLRPALAGLGRGKQKTGLARQISESRLIRGL